MQKKSYEDLQRMFGNYFLMPPENLAGKTEIEYRCPYYSKCPTGKKCFAAAAPVPLQDNAVLNVRCALCGGIKIPVYAVAARVRK